MFTMNKEILEAVQKSLPAMQMDALKAELAKAESVPSLQSTINTLKSQIESMNNDRQKLVEQLNEVNVRAKKTEELKEQERNLRVKELEIKLQCEQAISSNIREMAMAAFRNPTITKSFNIPVAVPGSAQCTGYVTNEHVTETTKTE